MRTNFLTTSQGQRFTSKIISLLFILLLLITSHRLSLFKSPIIIIIITKLSSFT